MYNVLNMFWIVVAFYKNVKYILMPEHWKVTKDKRDQKEHENNKKHLQCESDDIFASSHYLDAKAARDREYI